MINELPGRLRDIAATVDNWSAPLGARADLHAAAKEIERLRSGRAELATEVLQTQTVKGNCVLNVHLRQKLQEIIAAKAECERKAGEAGGKEK